MLAVTEGIKPNLGNQKEQLSPPYFPHILAYPQGRQTLALQSSKNRLFKIALKA